MRRSTCFASTASRSSRGRLISSRSQARSRWCRSSRRAGSSITWRGSARRLRRGGGGLADRRRKARAREGDKGDTVELFRLQEIDAFVVFDLEDAPHNAGGTRLAPDVTEEEGALLARAMTYKFAVLGHPLGGAKGLIRANADERTSAMARYCDEIRPLVESRRFATGPDLGTYETDFVSLRPANWEPHVVNSTLDGVAFEDVLTGFGVAVAADVALCGLDGRTVALEGFGKVGGGVAREICRRGARVVAISTMAGCVADPAGLDLDGLCEARAAHGDRLVSQIGRACLPREALFEVDAD